MQGITDKWQLVRNLEVKFLGEDLSELRIPARRNVWLAPENEQFTDFSAEAPQPHTYCMGLNIGLIGGSDLLEGHRIQSHAKLFNSSAVIFSSAFWSWLTPGTPEGADQAS